MQPRIRSAARSARSGLAGLAAAAALLLAVAACNPGTAPPPAQEQAKAAPAAADAQVVPVAPAVPGAPGMPVAPSVPAAPTSDLPPPRQVAPPTVDELQRKRAEWQEQQRMQEQSQADLLAWRRSRRPAEAGSAAPRVGDAAPPRETDGDRVARAMRAWYGHYAARAAAVSLALSQYGMALTTVGAVDPSRLMASCRDLRTASTALLADPQALPAPLDSVSAPLATAYTEIKATADSCLAYRQEDQAAHFAAAHQAMAQAGAALRPYRMVP